MKYQQDASHKGIFVQKYVEYKGAIKRTRKPFCVTFPRLANVTGNPKDDSLALFPSDDFSTFEQAHSFAIQFKRIDSRLKHCPIFLLENRWVGSSTKRELQRIG